MNLPFDTCLYILTHHTSGVHKALSQLGIMITNYKRQSLWPTLPWKRDLNGVRGGLHAMFRTSSVQLYYRQKDGTT